MGIDEDFVAGEKERGAEQLLSPSIFTRFY
jgi:hypothetical protein